jgi:hypothetical protein
MEGQDCINDLVKRRGSRTVSGPVLLSGPGGPAEMVLLGFIEDTIDTIHTDGRDSCLGVDDVESRSDGLDKVPYVGGHGMSIAVEDVNEDRPGIELLDGCLQRGWELHIRGCELLSIREGQSGARLSYFGLFYHELDCLRLSMAFTHASEGGQAISKVIPVQAGLKEWKTWSVILVVTKGRQPAVKGTLEA